MRGQDGSSVSLDGIDARLIDAYQRGFPLAPRPFAAIGAGLGLTETQVLSRLARLARAGVVSRVGPVLAPGVFGASTLAAMKIPGSRLAHVARVVNSFSEVNHNYEREHPVNLWFVVTAPHRERVQAVLHAIARATDLAVLDLPLERSYHIDLGFPLIGPVPRPARGSNAQPAKPAVGHRERAVAAALEAGLPLEARPFAAVAAGLGISEAEVIAALASMLTAGSIKRLGIIVRHHELGYRANAMTVWDVPDDTVDAVGRRLGSAGAVTLCYRRTRRPPAWSFNLYCMVHGRDRAQVQRTVEDLEREHGLAGAPRATLFSRRRFKQRGARYGDPGPVQAVATGG